MFKFLTILNSISFMIILVFGKETFKPKSNDLTVVQSQEHNFLESPSSYKRYQQNNNGYNEDSGGSGSVPEPYMFNYDIQDNDNNKQFRKETSDGNAIKGSYGYVDANGLYRTVEYTADSEYGFRARVKSNEPGMEAYNSDRNSQSTFPADVILEIGETPRNLQYSSSDQISNNHYSTENFGGQNYQRAKNYQQYNEPADHQYAASNIENKHFGRSLNYDSNKKEQNKINDNFIKWNTNSNTDLNTNQVKNFEYQSAYSDGHPVYVDSNLANSNTKNSNKKSLISNHPEMSEANSKIMTFVRNQKFSNKTTVDEKKDKQPKKLSATTLQLEKPIEQFKTLQYFRPFNEIRQKFINKSPRRFTGFTNDFSN